MREWYTKKCVADIAMVANRYKISEIFAEILVKRDLFTWEDMDEYLFGDEEWEEKELPEIYGMKEAARILTKAIEDNKKIRIVGDYDCDGVMSTYILYKGLSWLGAEVTYRLPHRVRDGYGMRDYMADEAKKDGVDVIVTCDNGISAVQAIERAKALGMTVVLTDHHEVPREDGKEVIPPADVVVDPKQEKETYEFREFCGAGIAYLLMCQMSLDKNMQELKTKLLPYAAVASVCDIVPLKKDNRSIVKAGLKLLRKTGNPGMDALLREMQVDGDVTAMDCGFRIGPCINAAGRLGDATFALELLLEENPEKANEMAKQLVTLNEERKSITRQVEQEALKLIDENNLPDILSLYVPDCDESVVGIVAGRIKEKYYRPTYLMTDSMGILKGSGRSIPTYHMQQSLQECREHLQGFGGHSQAAGFSLKKDDFDSFNEALFANSTLTEQDLVQRVYFDKLVDFADLTRSVIGQLSWIEPTGAGNDPILFGKKEAQISGVRMCGAELRIAQVTFLEGGKQYRGVDFRGEDRLGKAITKKYGTEQWEAMKRGEAQENIFVDLLFSVQIDEKYGSIQIMIEDCN